MQIVHIASEMAPAAKVGGLADVILGLARETQAQGHEVTVILPRYACLDYRTIEDLAIAQKDLWSYLSGAWIHNTIWEGRVAGIRTYFVEPHNATHYFGRPNVYGYPDDVERFTYFSRAALEFLLKAQINPDVLHIHEWTAAVVAPLYWDVYRPLGLDKPGILFTSHNFEHQGHCSVADLDRIGLDGARYLVADKLQHDRNPGVINLVKGAIVYSNWITTVSATYAEEVKTAWGGHDLHPTLQKYSFKFSGIVNGLDYTHWNPRNDPYLRYPYDDSEAGLSGKANNKRELRRRLQLGNGENRPLVASISRLVPQKGVELLKQAIYRTLQLGGQFVLLGSSPIPSIREDFYKLKTNLADNAHVHLELQPHEELTHLIYAGSDMFIIPSIFEPCGLTQLIAQAYGSVPIVRHTGGLADTVFDVDDAHANETRKNGYSFDEPQRSAVNTVLERAITTWKHDRPRWQALMQKGMRMDFSWKEPAAEYLRLYEQVRKAAAATL
jgi:starch synthase